MSAVWILGAGGHATVVAATLTALGHELAGVLDDNPQLIGQPFAAGATIDGPIDAIRERDPEAVVPGIGHNRTRRTVAERLPDLPWISLVHPTAWVAPGVNIEPGCVVMAAAVIQPCSQIGAQAIVNTGASVDHHNTIGAYAHIAPGARLAGNVRVGTGAMLGIGSCVREGVEIGAWSLAGAGAVVLRNVPPETTVVGNPARRQELSS